MIPTTEVKFVEVIQPASIAQNTETDVEIDTLGYDFCNVYILCGAMGAALDICKLADGDTSGGTFTDIAAATLGDSACVNLAGTAVALSATDDNDVICFQVDMSARGRYLKLLTSTANSSGASVFGAVAILGRSRAVRTDVEGDHVVTAAGDIDVIRV
jgi:hypothetical protein